MGDYDTMLAMRRHAPLSSSRALARQKRAARRPQVYLGRQRQPIRDIYLNEHPGERSAGRFRWLISTCLAGAVGVVAIAVVISGSLEKNTENSGFLEPLTESLQRSAMQPFRFPKKLLNGLNWAIPKTQRLQITSGVLSTKYIIRETMRQLIDNRETVLMKPYARLTSKLASVKGPESEAIPAFNPLALYSASPVSKGKTDASDIDGKAVAIEVIELLDGSLPAEDGEEMDIKDVTRLVRRLLLDSGTDRLATNAGQAGDEGLGSNGFGDWTSSVSQQANGAPAHNRTVLTKNRFEAEAETKQTGSEIRAVTVKRGDSLVRLLAAAGASRWQVGQMASAAARIFPAKDLSPGQTIYFTLVPSLTQAAKLELEKFSIFAPGGIHRVTVLRNAAGDFAGSTTPMTSAALQSAIFGSGGTRSTSLYESLFSAARQQGLSDSDIMAIMRIHAYETDFRKRIRAGDTADFFYDLKDDNRGADSPLGQMLFTSLTVGGKVRGFYKFRTSDGRVDYYDRKGENSKKFITRKPVRDAQVRLTSGFGLRRHPLLHVRKMHSGVDWAAARGTPILAGGNGTIEFAGRKGGYGNNVRIKHANGYKTTYSHMHRIARGIRPGVKVRQGQLIGTIGSTGLSSGPHLHYEVLVNNRQINPMKMRVPQERRLKGKDLSGFQRERARIDNLMRRSPVTRLGQ